MITKYNIFSVLIKIEDYLLLIFVGFYIGTVIILLYI